MAENLLDNARAQQAAAFPVVENEALNGAYMALQNVMNQIAIRRRFGHFANLGKKVIINHLSGNPYIDEIKNIIYDTMRNFRLKRITNDNLKEWSVKNYDIGDGVDVPTGKDGVRLDNIQDADFARHFFSNYDELSKAFMERADNWAKSKGKLDENYMRYIPAFGQPNKYGMPKMDPDIMMLNKNGRMINVHNLFREYYNRKMNEIFPTFKKASNTSIEDSIGNLEL